MTVFGTQIHVLLRIDHHHALIAILENVGYAKPGKAGVYNVLIMEERQTIVACGAGASTKRVWPQPNADGTHRIERCENVKDVGLYMKRIDEMIARKQQLFSEK